MTNLIDITDIPGQGKKIISHRIDGALTDQVLRCLGGGCFYILDEDSILVGHLTEKAIKSAVDNTLDELCCYACEGECDEEAARIAADAKKVKALTMTITKIKSPKSGRSGWRVAVA
tara:strand:+ start:532 stop:882 length:351 start_codon:yes stop_codon:yes gene_type:complete